MKYERPRLILINDLAKAEGSCSDGSGNIEICKGGGGVISGCRTGLQASLECGGGGKASFGSCGGGGQANSGWCGGGGKA